MSDANPNNDGGLAFPSPADERNGYPAEAGMTFRDYAAVHAPIPFELARQASGFPPDATFVNDADRETLFCIWALLRAEFADALIAELGG